MRLILVISIPFIVLFLHCTSDPPAKKGSKTIDHELWSLLLKKHVDSNGYVDYSGFLKDSLSFGAYLDQLTTHPPDEDNWPEEEQIAFWINAYNAFTIKLIIDHYPVESIKDIGLIIQLPFVNSPWDIRFIEMQGEKLDLNNIEHSILRKKFEEPRIHFAINCASNSCPKLRREAYTGQKLNNQLNDQAYNFINDPNRNYIQDQQAELSKIFSWFKEDFTKKSTLKEFLNQYSTIKLHDNTMVSFKNYDWSLNERH